MDFIDGVLMNFTVGNLEITKLREKVVFKLNSMYMRDSLEMVRNKDQGNMLIRKVNLNI